MKGKIDLSLILLAGLFFWSCSETKELDPDDYGSNYFPLKVGQYAVYLVKGVEYINIEDSVVFNYQLRETITETFEDLEQGISYKILREKRDNENDKWITDSIWTARKDEIRAIKTENNVSFIRLVFPLGENKTWDGNGLNGREPKDFEMVNISKQFAGDFGIFDQTVTVIEDSIPDRFVQFKSKKEVYSQHIGLVYKENVTLNYRQGDDYGLEIIDSGIKYFQSIVEYGEK